MGNKEHWETYHKQWKDRLEVPANPRTIKAILSILDIKNKKILEVGSGSGRDSVYMAKLGADCYLVDYVEDPLKIAKKIAEKALTFNTGKEVEEFARRKLKEILPELVEGKA